MSVQIYSVKKTSCFARKRKMLLVCRGECGGGGAGIRKEFYKMSLTVR